MDGLDTVQHKNLKTILSRGSYFTSSIRNLHTATSQNNNYVQPVGGKKKTKINRKSVEQLGNPPT